ncbi:SMC-Scp complex subunit ScpB [Alkalicaulis satelles]|uniref:SMC-Scp complex subunit ScpB n=1 Tax=Alkalicaulis satelles TaxID=2609175 RepID=A0A5M6ZNT7_9PROT|nr:SMC-Scp complex subunit ScpB [Alkalicaulis satelles]KAA5805377.1 SMC-Scp complex subunit ScpB [Alkalicaulis satelles]
MSDDTPGAERDPVTEAIRALRAEAGQRPGGDSGPPGVRLAVDNDAELMRMAEALLFAAVEPLDLDTLKARLPSGADVRAVIAALQAKYQSAGIQLMEVGGRWRFQTAPDLAFLLRTEREEPRKLSQAALETLAIIAYHQPVTRAEIEDIRGVAVSRGTLDQLLEMKWIRLRGRRRSPGRPVTYGVTDGFLDYFGLASLGDLPGVSDLKAAGLLSSRLPPDFMIPEPGRILPGEEEDLFSDEEAADFHVDFLDVEEED